MLRVLMVAGVRGGASYHNAVLVLWSKAGEGVSRSCRCLMDVEKGLVIKGAFPCFWDAERGLVSNWGFHFIYVSKALQLHTPITLTYYTPIAYNLYNTATDHDSTRCVG